MKAGASGFLLKDVRRRQLAEAVRTVMAGDALVAPQITRRLIENFCHRPPASSGIPSTLSALTSRELETLRLVARGLTNTEIAETLIVGQTTVKTHVAHILNKLGLKDRRPSGRRRLRVRLRHPGQQPHHSRLIPPFFLAAHVAVRHR